MEMFEKALRLKLRFTSPVGPLTVEDLWDLPLTSKTKKANLDDVARSLNKALKEDDVSFVEPKSSGDEEVQLAFDVVRHVIKVKQDENAVLAAAVKRKEDKQRIMAILDEKKDQELKGKSREELETILATM